MTYTITADGKECFETESESEAQEMLALLIAHQQDEPELESRFSFCKHRWKIMHDYWKSEHPIGEIWADSRIYELKNSLDK